MQYCKKCRIEIRGNKICCPLCRGELSGDPTDPVTAGRPAPRAKHLSIIKLTTFLFALLEIAMLALHTVTRFQLAWVYVVMAAGVIVWLDVTIGIYYRSNVIRTITTQVYIAMVISVVVDRVLGMSGWSVTWVVPSCFVGLVIVTLSVGRGLRMLLEDYILYLAADMLLSLGQACFLALEWNTFWWPAVISMAFLAALAAAALIFRFRDLKNAAEKQFHM